jgi:RNA polymerase sigma-70 factor, ECF subfamily
MPERDALPATHELFERYGGMVFRRCAAILRNDEAARDAVQEIFLRVIERRRQFRGDASPVTWLYAIATLHCLQQLRDRAGRLAKLALYGDEPRTAGARDPAERLAVFELLEGEPEDTRLMVYLHYIDGLTMDEVAAAIGLSRKTVSRRVNEFLASARAQFVAEGGAS